VGWRSAGAYKAALAGYAPVASAGEANDAFEVYVLTLILRAGQEDDTLGKARVPNRVIFVERRGEALA
jgi:hypothetical protein